MKKCFVFAAMVAALLCSTAAFAQATDQPILFAKQPSVTWGQGNFMNICVENCQFPLTAGYNGAGFPPNTLYRISKTTGPDSQLFGIEYQLPAQNNPWVKVTFGMLVGLTPVEGNARPANPWVTVEGLPPNAQFRVHNGQPQWREGWTGPWQPLMVANASGTGNDPILIFERDVPNPDHPDRIAGKIYVVYNTVTGEMVVIVPNISGLYKTIRHGIYTAGGVGALWIVCVILFFA